LEFTHFVYIKSENSTFGCARDTGGRLKLYLIGEKSVKAHNGECWFDLPDEFANLVIKRANDARDRVPTYKTERVIF
jgi:hypothetical protein